MQDQIEAQNDPRKPDPGALDARDDILGDGKGWVELQDMLPAPSSGLAPDMAVVNAARVSFLGHSKDPEKDKKLLFYLLEHGHTTPFEQVEFKFRVRAPVVVWWQWVRHRTWHYNFQSGRYLPFAWNDFYIPAEWRLQSASNKQGSEGFAPDGYGEQLSLKLASLVDETFELYQEALSEGIAKEQARLFLPAWGAYYIAVCKVDAWNLMHFLRLRTARDAQWEIRQYALALYDIFKEKMPWAGEAFDRFARGER